MNLSYRVYIIYEMLIVLTVKNPAATLTFHSSGAMPFFFNPLSGLSIFFYFPKST